MASRKKGALSPLSFKPDGEILTMMAKLQKMSKQTISSILRSAFIEYYHSEINRYRAMVKGEGVIGGNDE